MIDMYTDERLGKPATIGETVYFDWWYPGSIDCDIYPPPRPQADAVFSYAGYPYGKPIAMMAVIVASSPMPNQNQLQTIFI